MENIVFYDGECGLCQRSVAFLIALDKKRKLKFAPLNGETYQRHFKERSDLSTVAFLKGNLLYTKSDAIIEVGRSLGGLRVIFILLKLIPRFIRDIVYDFVARHRKKVSCILLIKDERFLK